MLEKLWGQPAHPIYVHFPVALFTVGSVLVWVHLLDGQSRWLSRFLKKIRLGDFNLESISFFSIFLVLFYPSGLSLDFWSYYL